MGDTTDDDSDGGRTKRVTFYVTESEQNALKREAEERGLSLSSYVLRLVNRQRQLESEEELAEELNVEQRLGEITKQAVEEIEDSVSSVEDATAALQDLHARAGTYPLVNFRLLMRQHKPPQGWIKEEFTRARDNLRQPLDEYDPTEGLNSSAGADRDRDRDTATDDDGPKDVDDLV